MMKALIVGVRYKEMNYDLDNSLIELEELCKACNIEVIKRCVQNLDKINPSLYIGTGKVQEIKGQLDNLDLVIFNEELSPLQVKNLTDILDIEVTDRTDLILRIFEVRAKTKEAKLQVEIAKGQYLLPRLAGMKEHLYSQQGGSGFRGSGEKQIELDRRLVSNQIFNAKKQLANIVKQRQNQRKRRKDNEMKVIALVGYTNSGKSTLMNAFCLNKNKQVLQKDMLFATLETAARRIDLPQHQSFLLTDTVGFVSNLPHHLVEAFKSTLEEISDADLLLHVVDSSSPERQQMVRVTTETLKALGADKIPTIYLYNKADLLTDTQKQKLKLDDDTYFFSTKTKEGFDTLVARIRTELFQDFHKYALLVPYNRGDITAFYHEHVEVMQESFENEGTRLYIFASEKIAMKYHEDIIEVKKLGED